MAGFEVSPEDFCCSTGNVTDEIVAEYIANQTDNRDDDFKVEG